LAAWLIRVLRRSKLAKTTSKNIFSDPSLSSKAIFANAGGRESDEVYLSRRSLGELLEIENSLLALRELYQRKLIPADVYVKESQKYAESL
jgi:hypothetical protein